jgi:hypothetical protein
MGYQREISIVKTGGGHTERLTKALAHEAV